MDRNIIFKDTKNWLRAMKTHKCENKSLTPADDPSTDMFSALMGNRKPKVFPKLGYVCFGCGEYFQIELKNLNPKGLSKEIKKCFSSGKGKAILGEKIETFNI